MDEEELTRFAFKMHLVICVLALLTPMAQSQRTCQNYNDLFLNLNKYDPAFDSVSYVTDKIIVKTTFVRELIRFQVVDKDVRQLSSRSNISQFDMSTNNSIFQIQPDFEQNNFFLTLSGNLSYNVDRSHRYVVEMKACDRGVPRRCGTALVFVPLLNYNMNKPSFFEPTILVAAVTFNPGHLLGILNSWDLDGDAVSFSMDPSTSAEIRQAIQVLDNGRVILRQPLTSFSESIVFFVKLTDDGSSNLASGLAPFSLSNIMPVELRIIEVNMHSPEFVPLASGHNYCDKTFRAAENSFFRIEISARDEDTRGENGLISFLAPEITDRSPQNAFTIFNGSQSGRVLNGFVQNIETFDFENPKYGSNIMNIMVIAEDRGLIRRRGYCFLTIQIEDINDNVPKFSQNSYSIFMHEQYKTRQFSYRFVAVDKDSGVNGSVQYFIDPNSSAAVLELFNLDLNGTLTLRENALDKYRDVVDFEFFIYAEDMSPFRNRSDLVRVRVSRTTLKLLPPFFADFPSSAEIHNVSEMAMRGTVLRDFSISIQTKPDNQFLRCLLSPKPNPEWFKFERMGSTQALSMKETCSLRIEDPLNYRVAKSMIVYLVAEIGTDQVASTARELKILTIFLREENINPPKFVTNTIEASVVEGRDDLGKVIAKVKAYDLDLTPSFNTISYHFEDNSNLDRFFTINSTSGEIKLINTIQNKRNIPLEVVAMDGANGFNIDRPNMNTIYVDVRVIDINDNEPVFSQPSYEFEVAEDVPLGHVIGRLEVSDPDIESYFNYSISDSTFGIRGIFDHTKTKLHSNYRGSAEIYLNNFLDYRNKSVYNLLTFVSDSFFVVNCSLTIRVLNVVDRPPAFKNTPYISIINEMEVPDRPMFEIAAIDTDLYSTQFLFELYPTPFFHVINEWFRLEQSGDSARVSLLRPLNSSCDLPDTYNVPVSVAYKDFPQLKSFTNLTVKLTNVNLNPPHLVYASNRPLIIDEERNSAFVEFYVDDCDGEPYAKPYSLELTNNTNVFRVERAMSCAECDGTSKEKYRLISTRLLRREDKKVYAISYRVVDNGGLTRVATLKLIIGDVDNNPQEDGQKKVTILSFENNFQTNSDLGTLYVKDLDDWDLSTKQTSQCTQTMNDAIQIGPYLKMVGPRSFSNFPNKDMSLQCVVTDRNRSQVVAKVQFAVENVQYADLVDLTAIRFLGIKAEDLMKKITLQEQSFLDQFLIKLIGLFELNDSNDLIKVITVKNYLSDSYLYPNPDNKILDYDLDKFGTDIYLYIRKSNKLVSSRRIYDIMASQINLFDHQAYSLRLLYNECLVPQASCSPGTFCKQNFIQSQQSLTVDANATSFVGLNVHLSTDCFCQLEVVQPTCFNGGTVIQSKVSSSEYFCQCPDGYEGPRCEFLSITFTFNPSSRAHSYALFDHIELCDPLRIEFEFTTERSKGLLLFNGPINRDAMYFIAVEILNKNLLVHIGPNNVSFDNIVVSNREWHKVDISWSLDTVQVNLDNCQSKLLHVANYEEMKSDLLETDQSRLSLGGIPPNISINHYYYNQLNVFEFEGCIRNVRVNGDLRNLKLNPNEFNLAQNLQQCDCIYTDSCVSVIAPVVRSNEFPWWIIVVILGALACLALILGLAVCTVRRKDNQKKILHMFPDDDIRETIINYADGAGEENTENFNIGVMKKPVGPIVQTMNTLGKSGTSQQELDCNDQNMIFAYEGEGSDVGSLSSVGSNCEDKDIDLEYLGQWGPKFVKLASIYTRADDPNADYQNKGYEYNDDYRAPR